MISVLILTRNEEKDLPGCLESVSWSDDIHVFDSFSNDRTVEIAQARGAYVVQRAFDGYASQRNAALSGSSCSTPTNAPHRLSSSRCGQPSLIPAQA